jgi:D-glycero-alpha-D-manno-heptose-7-phosphate kinase
MIVSKSPLRLSFFSGGSDLPAFYKKEMGAALSVTIDKYIHVCARRTPNIGIKTMFDKVEQVNDINEMQEGIVKETLKYYKMSGGITVASISDILSRGSGLGSSSAFTVGLIRAISTMKKIEETGKSDWQLRPETLAEHACNVEMSLFPVGKQDQYAAAYGGCNLFEFYDFGYVKVTGIEIDIIEKLQNNLLLVYSGRGRSANEILRKQQNAMADITKFNLVKASRDKAYMGFKMLLDQDFDSFGALLHDAWMDKKSVVQEITQDYFDVIYNKALSAGALGGKLLGAGGGGFFIFYVNQNNREKVIKAISENTECVIYDFNFCNRGSEILIA